MFAYDTDMELPGDFAERVNRLRDPQGFLAEMVAALEAAERLEVTEARSRTARAIFDGLPPDARRRYIEIINPDSAKIIYWQPSPEQAAFKRRIEERLAWLHSDDPAADERREELRLEYERRSASIAEEMAARREQVEERLRDAGLEVIPEVIDWLSDFPRLPAHKGERSRRGGSR